MPQAKNRLPDYLLILDFEATCHFGRSNPVPQEIIEFPTLLMNTKTKEIEDTFHYYVKPEVHPKLSNFCVDLTGITQEVVDSGISFDDVLARHREWLDKHNLATLREPEPAEKKSFLYVTYGDWDLKTCLVNQCRYHKKAIDDSYRWWIDIRVPWEWLYKKRSFSFAKALKEMGLPMEGRHHSGIDDCKNLANMCAQMLDDGWVPMATSFPPKTVYLIRHGQSEAEAALDRRMDERLRDCGLTSHGQSQALGVQLEKKVELVISSPMKRALETSMLAFQDVQILVHYDLRELGGRMVENEPRPMNEILNELPQTSSIIDTESLMPKGWPQKLQHKSPKRNIPKIFEWIVRNRTEHCIAVVCHHNVIQKAFAGRTKFRISPQACQPIECSLRSTGELVQLW